MAFLQNVSVLQAAANMVGLAPGAAVGIVLDAGRVRVSLENIGAGNAGGRVIPFNTSRTIGA